MNRKGWTGLAACAVIFFLPSVVLGQINCDEDLIIRAFRDNVTNPYRSMNDNRCEGFYIENRSTFDGADASSMRLSSLLETFPSYDVKKAFSFNINWNAPIQDKDKDVFLQAIDLVDNVGYRMDAAVRAEEGKLVWPGDILRTKQIEHDDLLVKAWYRGSLDDFDRDIFLPLKFSPGKPVDSESLAALIQSTEPLSMISFIVEYLGTEGNTPPADGVNKLVEGTYLPREVIKLNLKLSETGFYRLRITAEISEAFGGTNREGEDPDSIVETFYFYAEL